MNKSEFQKDLAIDPEQLDVACVAQAETFFKWAERSITARSEMDRLDLVLKVTEARLSADVRRNPESYGLEGRLTEANYKAAVMQSDKYMEAHDAWLNAREEYNLLDKGVDAMDMKKRQLENLITLHGQQYFAGPGTPRNLTKAYLDHQERIGQSVVQRQKKQLRKPKGKLS